MPEVMAPAAQLIKANRVLSEDARQHMVLLRFREPVPRGWVQEFFRIHLTPGMHAQGEAESFRAEIFQPGSLRRSCVRCAGPVTQMGLWQVACQNKACRLHGRPQSTKPSRGVVQVLVPRDQQVRVDGQLRCRSVVLVLDRRYPEQVLGSVYRTAGMICEQLGWGLL